MNSKGVVSVLTLMIAFSLCGCALQRRVAREMGQTMLFVLPGGATIEMVWIEPGMFMMGSPENEPGRENDEGPQHRVTITRGFWFGTYELTQEQWESVMGMRPWEGEEHVQEAPNYPAVYISWEDVQAFIDSLNVAEDSRVYRLPTEAEWEYACRAGATTRWSFGDNERRLGEYAWYRDNAWDTGEEHAHAVGTKRPNRWGLYDMQGNVWEWCQDWHNRNYYSIFPQKDPSGPASGFRCAIRGGAFNYPARDVRSAKRNGAPPVDRSDDIGARLVRQEP